MEYIYIIMKHWNKKTNMGIQKAKHNLENNIKYWHGQSSGGGDRGLLWHY